MEKVQPGKFVAFAYKLSDNDSGELLFEATKERPDVMVYGVSHEIVPGLVQAMTDLAVGDRFETVLPPLAAFGEPDPQYIMELDRQIFEDEDGNLLTELSVGARIPMMTQEGYRVEGKIVKLEDDKVVMDFNHPFAGRTVKYEGEIVTVRDATPEELQPAHGCCCGHDHGSCGDGCGDSCGAGSCGDCCK